MTGSVVKGLIGAGALMRIDRLEDEPYPDPILYPEGPGLRSLSALQQKAADELIIAVEKNEFRVAAARWRDWFRQDGSLSRSGRGGAGARSDGAGARACYPKSR
ncbi:MAG: hypothetical protein WDN76_02615 [Alphaproteobacteria bacterium]